MDQKSKKRIPHWEDKERIVGQVPVILHGLPTGPESDLSGLPSYLTSSSTKQVSAENERIYEQEAMGVTEEGLSSLFAQAESGQGHTEMAEANSSQDRQERENEPSVPLPTYEDALEAERDQLARFLESKQSLPGS